MVGIDQSRLSFDVRHLKLACGADALRALIKALLARFAAYRQMRHERAQLLGLGDRELRDIGISRVDAIHAATKPLGILSRRHAPACSGHPRRDES